MSEPAQKSVTRADVIIAIRAARDELQARAVRMQGAKALLTSTSCTQIAAELGTLRYAISSAFPDDSDETIVARAFAEMLARVRRDAAAFREIHADADAHQEDSTARELVKLAGALGVAVAT